MTETTTETTAEITRVTAWLEEAQATRARVNADLERRRADKARFLATAEPFEAERHAAAPRRAAILQQLPTANDEQRVQLLDELSAIDARVGQARRRVADIHEAAAGFDPAIDELLPLGRAAAVRELRLRAELDRLTHLAACQDLEAELRALQPRVEGYRATEAAFRASFMSAYGRDPGFLEQPQRLARTLQVVARELLGPVDERRLLSGNFQRIPLTDGLDELRLELAVSAAAEREQQQAIERQRERERQG